MLLDLASKLQAELNVHQNAPGQNVTLQFVFFDGEEAFVQWNQFDSIYGARHLAKKWEATPYAVKGQGEREASTNYLHRMVCT
jgi:glutaminyl-peptide cyclotransferase